MSSSVRSLAAKIRALADAEVPFDEAERLLVATYRPAEVRARDERRETADALGLGETRSLARETRLRRWLGVDIAPPPEAPEEDENASTVVRDPGVRGDPARARRHARDLRSDE